LVGPFRGGRSVAVAGDPNEEFTFYFGACAGGVFKTVDGGASWRCVSDGFFRTGSVGAIAVADSDPNVIVAGTGEACIRSNVSHGDGVYRSLDGGRTWTNVGLRDTRHIARVRIHPHDPALIYVAALGHAWGPNRERGIFRSEDGGGQWEQVLYRGEHAGACDLAIDPLNPRILYAAFWEARRSPHSLSSGGEGSGLHKSIDGGRTWVSLTDNPGLPRGLKGRIGVAVSGAKEGRVWAVIEAISGGGLYRSDDGGTTWELVDGGREHLQRPFYFMHIFAHPTDPDELYSLNISHYRSTDGGTSFASVPVSHGDCHDLWIDPRRPQRMITGNDGGACVSFDGGRTWSTQQNQPTGQFYHVTSDTRTPYRLYGSQQDEGTVSIPTRSDAGAITRLDWHPVAGDESGYIAVRPDNPDIVFAGVYQGRITRYDHSNGQARDVTVWPEDVNGWGAKDHKHRFQWTFPIVLSPHDPGQLYACGNVVFRSQDEGQSWEIVSPDLTRHEEWTLEPSGGPITKDNYNTETYATIFAFAESPVEQGVLWAGSDDGLVHVSRDNGETWSDVTPAALPERALISVIEASPHKKGGAYLAATRYKSDDVRPYLYKTDDYGQTWTFIANGIPETDFTRVVRADPVRDGLLFAGTETGLYVSFDDGASWTHSVQLNLPLCPIYDILIKDGDLAVATHGRAFWMLDDITPLRDHQAAAGKRLHVFEPRPATRIVGHRYLPSPEEPGRKLFLESPTGAQVTALTTVSPDGRKEIEFIDAGENPPDGLIVDYLLGRTPDGPVVVRVFQSDGALVTEFRSDTQLPDPQPRYGRVTADPGMNRFVWNLRYPGPLDRRKAPAGNGWMRPLAGPFARPARYLVEVAVDGEVARSEFEVRLDPRAKATEQEIEEQFEFLIRCRDLLSRCHAWVNRAESTLRLLAFWIEELESHGEDTSALVHARGALAAASDELVQSRVELPGDEAAFPPGYNSKLIGLMAFVGAADAPPTSQSYDVLQSLETRMEGAIARLHELMDTEFAELEAKMRRRLGSVLVPPLTSA
jgi:photosystem II stability/assembly factor-like uncharacterized protein